ncbi:hypothetical protein VNO78_08227 [Psophocarpus tetragonolobus]|uniref:Pentatricopeptide repeat-containing protein n=1 Tax=Psophocarpus tetragonolobus TaxID=3891 RepID=A0AAN9XST0_PSOTE
METKGLRPSNMTFTSLLQTSSLLEHLWFGSSLHAKGFKLGLNDICVQTSLLNMYSTCRDLGSAKLVVWDMVDRDYVAWNSLILGYVKNNKNVFVGSTLVRMYFKNHEGEAAQRVFYSIAVKGVVIWTEIITGYSKMTYVISAIRCFFEMVHEAHEVDDYVLNGVLSACVDLVVFKQGEIIHCYAVKLGYDIEMSISESPIDMYAKNGGLEVASLVFSQVLDPDLKCWNLMLGGYSHHGMVDEALKIFKRF